VPVANTLREVQRLEGRGSRGAVCSAWG